MFNRNGIQAIRFAAWTEANREAREAYYALRDEQDICPTGEHVMTFENTRDPEHGGEYCRECFNRGTRERKRRAAA